MHDLHLIDAAADPKSRRLSSVLTPVFKFGFSATFLVIAVVWSYLTVTQAFSALSILNLALASTFVLLLAYSCLRLKRVVAHSGHLAISNYIAQTKIPYDDIEEIKGYRARSAVFVRLRLRTCCRFGRTIHFLLPSTLAGIQSQPELQLLRAKCPHLCEQSQNWWTRTLYLRPHSRHT